MNARHAQARTLTIQCTEEQLERLRELVALGLALEQMLAGSAPDEPAPGAPGAPMRQAGYARVGDAVITGFDARGFPKWESDTAQSYSADDTRRAQDWYKQHLAEVGLW